MRRLKFTSAWLLATLLFSSLTLSWHHHEAQTNPQVDEQCSVCVLGHTAKSGVTLAAPVQLKLALAPLVFSGTAEHHDILVRQNLLPGRRAPPVRS